MFFFVYLILKTPLPRLSNTQCAAAVKRYSLSKAKDYFLCQQGMNRDLYFTQMYFLNCFLK